MKGCGERLNGGEGRLRKEVLLCDICGQMMREDDRSKFAPVPIVFKDGSTATIGVTVVSEKPIDICWACIKRIMGWESVGELT